MSFFYTLAPLLLAAGSPAASEPCDSIPGWEQVLTEEVRWIVVGEVHGTNEVPDIFADAVCLTAQSGPIMVGIEQPSIDQAAVEKFIASDGGEEAKREFLRSAMWNILMKDGRSSSAYFGLFETLRQMWASGLIAGVVAFQPYGFSSRPTPEEYERAMADLLIKAAEPGVRVLALVGSVHAMRTEVPSGSPYLAMAAHLPADETITLNTMGNGGEAWNCGGPDGCGAQPLYGDGAKHTRRVDLTPAMDGAYSGVLYLGSRTTASLPQDSSAAADSWSSAPAATGEPASG